jgi:hypothetical protein
MHYIAGTGQTLSLCRPDELSGTDLTFTFVAG